MTQRSSTWSNPNSTRLSAGSSRSATMTTGGHPLLSEVTFASAPAARAHPAHV
jgi:hypothetical protein